MKVLKQTIQDQQRIQYAFWVLVGLIVFCIIAYVLMINKTVFNIVRRQTAESQITKVNSDLSELEAEHVALVSKITPEYALELGFTEPLNPQYLSFKDGGDSFSLNTTH